jgi:hypothetical protein
VSGELNGNSEFKQARVVDAVNMVSQQAGGTVGADIRC